MNCVFNTLEKKMQHIDSFNRLIKEEKLYSFKIGAIARDLYTPKNKKYYELDKIAKLKGVEGVYEGVDKQDYDNFKILDKRMDDAISKRIHAVRMLRSWFGYDITEVK